MVEPDRLDRCIGERERSAEAARLDQDKRRQRDSADRHDGDKPRADAGAGETLPGDPEADARDRGGNEPVDRDGVAGSVAPVSRRDTEEEADAHAGRNGDPIVRQLLGARWRRFIRAGGDETPGEGRARQCHIGKTFQSNGESNSR